VADGAGGVLTERKVEHVDPDEQGLAEILGDMINEKANEEPTPAADQPTRSDQPKRR
jgi:hypothetical protein